ncbi:C-X-C motif chemokine 11-1-like [Polyodon spathula]|uniref:C-X-C motif chemokine 11-1-like n=1 Tax=Polyodon spathula TaxID=7913 RepID=UPI001B7F71CE|nr:C-X-C motif chemokine 11-1-like [Polyodon spathula]
MTCCSHFYSTHPEGKMNITTVALCALLFLVATTEERIVSSGQKCLCIGEGLNFIKTKLIRNIQVFQKSITCDKVEIIATFKKTGKQECLKPDSKRVKKILDRLLNKRGLKQQSKRRQGKKTKAFLSH